MPRAATTTDAFNAISEVRRREILGLLAEGEWSVNELVESLEVTQPQVSKHLRVLREVGLVEVREEGRYRWYRLNADELKPVFDWVQVFERFWNHQLSSIKTRAEAKARAQRTGTSGKQPSKKGK